VNRSGATLFAQPLATWERDGLKATLARAGLPADDLGDDGPLFWRFERDDVPVGFAGIEVHGADALLRSLVTLPPLRLQGVGGAMVDKMETEARARGARAIYLLTGDSVEFFTKLGYAPCERTRVPAAIAATGQFARLAAATVMMKQIESGRVQISQ
jgi:N-acetylglutamate synthase-like GNAT family acetyltransferase